GITITPDRLCFVAVLLVFLFGARISKPKRTVRCRVGYLLALFAVIGTLSALTMGAASVEVREEFKDLGDFASLGTLAVVAYQPLLIYLIAKRIRYTRALARMLVCTLCVIGAYLGWTGIAERYHASFFVFPEYILSPSVGIQFGRVRGPFVSSTVDG